MVNLSILISSSEVSGPGGLFDFNATLPLVAIQFILLMLILNTILYSPLLAVIEERKNSPSKDSYVSSLFEKGINKIAQKVGEESVETVIEAIANNEPLFMEEAADLFFHYLILLKSKAIYYPK